MENKQTKQNVGMVVVRGTSLPISTKKSVVLCKLLKNKKIEPAIKFFEEIIDMKKGIKMNKRETLKPGKGTKYPIKTTKQFVKLLKNLNANAVTKGLDVSKLVLSASANQASRPLKAGARFRKFKRTHVKIEGKIKEDKK
ncbi:uL22 family ribosomal protein [Nanoarchaeota archaeon]